MAADTKLAQSMLNVAGRQAQQLQAMAVALTALREKFNAASPDVTGTPLAGRTTAVSAWIDQVVALAANPVATALIAAIVPSHRGMAFDNENEEVNP